MTVDRRQFVRRTSLGASLGAASISMAVRPVAGKDERQYGCRFAMGAAQRRWLGPELWANPLPDWRVKDGVAECLRAAPNRNVQRLTLDLSAKNQPFDTAVTLTRVGGRKLAGRGSAGFTIGIRGPLEDFRNRLVFGTGLAAGLTMDGRVFIGRPDDQSQVRIGLGSLTEVQLRLLGKPAGNKTALTLQVVNPANGKLLGQTTKQVPAHQLAGNLGVTANFGGRGRGAKTLGGVGQFGFGAWTIGGPRVLEHPERRGLLRL